MLKRDISGANVLIGAAGGMVGSGWLFSPFISAQIAGSNSLVSWLLAALFMLFIALPLCELGTMLPISGGMTNYPSFTHGRQIGFLFAWTSWLSYVVMTPIEIQAILQYSSHFFPSLIAAKGTAFNLSGLGFVLAMSIMFAVVLLNSFGIKMLAECNKIASLIKFLIPSIAITAFLFTSPHFQNIKISLNTKEAWVQIFTALSTGGIAFAFTGFQNGLMLAGEVQNPQRNIPFAILGALLIGLILYFLLQLSFLVAIPQAYLKEGWQSLNFPGASGPLIGLASLLGLGFVVLLLMYDAIFSPFGTTLIYTAATSRILYGMTLNNYLPQTLLRLNKYKIPYLTLYINLLVGILSFLPFPGWQKMVAFLSSCSILSYGIGPICLLAMRELQPQRHRPFKLRGKLLFCHLAFYFCNLMLYWCGFDILWKLNIALLLGYLLNLGYQKQHSTKDNRSLYWFCFYMLTMLTLSYLGSFGGIGQLQFPLDLILIFPVSIVLLRLSQQVLVAPGINKELTAEIDYPEKEGLAVQIEK